MSTPPRSTSGEGSLRRHSPSNPSASLRPGQFEALTHRGFFVSLERPPRIQRASRRWVSGPFTGLFSGKLPACQSVAPSFEGGVDATDPTFLHQPGSPAILQGRLIGRGGAQGSTGRQARAGSDGMARRPPPEAFT